MIGFAERRLQRFTRRRIYARERRGSGDSLAANEQLPGDRHSTHSTAMRCKPA
jgi:hypothetical protein